MTRIKVNGLEKDLPAGVESLGEDDLFNVPYSLLTIADEEEDNDTYQWTNPRRLGQTNTSMGCGFTKQEMEELYTDIKDEGLLSPLICRWIVSSDGSLLIQLLEGERRWRCIDLQLKNGEKVWSRKEKTFLHAKIVHEKVQCRIIIANDKEALKIAFMVSDRSVAWGEGATAKLVKKLRKCNCSDKEILELTKKSFQWLKEQDEICQLDDLTFNYLIDGKINRALALRLVKVTDINRRHKYLQASYDDAVTTYKEDLEKADVALARAEEKEEIAEVVLSEAQEKGDQEAVAVAEVNLQKTQDKTRTRRRQRSEVSKPRAKTKNLHNIADDDMQQPLRPGKIRKEIETVTTLIDNDGKDENGKLVADVEALEAVRYCYNHNILGGEDIVKVLMRLNIQQEYNEDAPEDDEELDELEESIEID